MIINRRHLAKEKIEQLKKGFSAYAETTEIANYIEKELVNLDLPIQVERTSLGAWFIPVKD